MTRVLRKHGLSRTPEYRAWQTMRLRCTVPTNPAWADYGGRGITVCARWLESPHLFVADMGPKPSPAHELDRIDNDAGYSPENCRWVLRSTNDRNRRSNRLITYGGETLPLVEWAERFDIGPDTVSKRLDAGWEVERALAIPARAKAPAGQSKASQRHPCADCGKPVMGARCHRCENVSRAAPCRTAQGLVGALLE